MTVNAHLKFVIQAIPEKGLGVIATEPIDEGEVIISEAPLFTQKLRRNVHTIVASLATKSVDEKRQYLSLTNCHKPNKYPPIQGIFETNALPCGGNRLAAGLIAKEGGLFLQCSRFNSSCTPNVHNCWDPEHGLMVMRALKPVGRGEELCICYVGEWAPRDTRRSKLKTKFGFTCNCTSCSLDGEALITSDHRRMQLERLENEIGECGSNPVLGVQKVKIALRLLREEGLVHGEDHISYDAFQFCVSCSNYQLAKAWAEKAWRASHRASGSGDESTKKFSKFVKNPKAHPAWGLIRQKIVGLEGPDA